ncbi:class V-like SAM-binding methyltransferase superfamily-like protein [Binucleata daphniae]
MNLTGKTYKICSICKELCQTYLKCNCCEIESHFECFYSQAHFCKTCKYCKNDECIAKLRKRNKTMLKSNNLIANLQNTKNVILYKKLEKEDVVLSKTVKKIEKQIGAFDLIKYQIINKNYINEIVVVYGKSFIAFDVLGILLWTNFCKICCSNFHTTKQKLDVCVECQVCWNCGITKKDIDKSTNKKHGSTVKTHNSKTQRKETKNKRKNTSKKNKKLKKKSDKIEKMQVENEEETIELSEYDRIYNSTHSCEIDKDICKNKKFQFLFVVPKRKKNLEFVIYKTLARDFNFTEQNYVYCNKCYDKYVMKDEVCPICLLQYTEDNMIECDWCLRWIHYSCLKDKNIIKQVKKDEKVIYKCLVCEKFEDVWLGNLKKFPKILQNNKEQFILNFCTKDEPPCILCNKNFNDMESILVTKQVIHGTDLQLYAHKICLYSCFEQKNNIFYAKISQKICKKCNQSGAHVKCVFCDNIYYHFDCAFDNQRDLFRSNIAFPICQLHYSIHIDNINVITYNLNKLKFYIKESIKPEHVRINDFVISNDGFFTKFLDKNQNYKLFFDFKNVYLDDVKMTQIELENECKEKDIRLNIVEIFAEYNKIIKNLNIKASFYQRYNQCLNKNVQENNYTLSYISHITSTNKDLVIQKSNIHGKGVFASRIYYPNEVIIDYKGKKITFEESNIYEKKYKDADFYMFKTSEEVIDATIFGNIAKFINQSCDPNCYSTEATYGSKRGILICAKRFIFVGEELTYRYMINGNKLGCNCKTVNCRKTLN